MARDARIDTIRGFAMVTIVINHFSTLTAALGMKGPQIPTATTISLSSAAEIFVALSGYMVGMVYVKKANPTELLVKRAAKLYVWNFGLYIAAALATLATNPAYEAAVRFTPMTIVPLQAVAYFSVMSYGPFLIDILHLYVILLLVSPIAVWLIRRSPLLLIAASLSAYLVFQVCLQLSPDLAGPPNPLETAGWRFHPLAWQMIFFVAMAAGSARLHERVFAVLEKQPWLFWTALLVFAAIGAAKLILDLPHIPLADRGTLGPVRAAHSILVLLLYAGLVTALRKHLDNLLLRSAALIGRHSLNAFLFSTIATFFALYAWQQLELGWVGYVTLTGVLIFATWAAARYLDRRKFSDSRPLDAGSFDKLVIR